MKFTKVIIIPIFVCLILSCNYDTVHYHSYYYKSFFLGEDNVIISGKVFKDFYFTEPASFSTIYAGTDPHEVTGWKAVGTVDKNNFQIELKKTSDGGVTLSSSTIHNDSQYIWGLDGGYIVMIAFYFDDADYPYYYSQPSYKEKNLSNPKGEDDSWAYYYVYVAEPVDLSKTIETEGKDVFGYKTNTTKHYNYNFDKPGWYKICDSYPYNNRPINNDPKHFSGNNTYLYKRK
jgi:hypothetical protein